MRQKQKKKRQNKALKYGKYQKILKTLKKEENFQKNFDWQKYKNKPIIWA